MRTRLLATSLAAAAATVPFALPATAHAAAPQANWECTYGTTTGLGIVAGLQCVNVGDNVTAGQIEIPGSGWICSSIEPLLGGLIVEATGCFN